MRLISTELRTLFRFLSRQRASSEDVPPGRMYIQPVSSFRAVRELQASIIRPQRLPINLTQRTMGNIISSSSTLLGKRTVRFAPSTLTVRSMRLSFKKPQAGEQRPRSGVRQPYRQRCILQRVSIRLCFSRVRESGILTGSDLKEYKRKFKKE